MFASHIARITRNKVISNSIQYRMCSTSKELVVVEKLGAITTIGINRPEKRNCVNAKTADALLKAFQDVDADDSALVSVLYGVGGNFCAGYDLSELSSTGNSEVATQLVSRIGERGPMGPTRYETIKPVVAAIEGFAVAGGLELALWCDLRVMDETAVMGVFCRRFGVPLIDGGTVRLPATIGLGRALDLILTGRPVKAPEALNFGLATSVVACGTALGRAVHAAKQLEKYPQEALRADRRSARQAAFMSSSLQEALMAEHRRGLVALEEAQRGATRFVKGAGKHGSFRDFNDETTSKL